MSEDAHYRFPPAAAYRLNRCLFALKSDAAFRESFQQDAARAMTEAGLGDHEQKLMLAPDPDPPVAAGAPPYPRFMAGPRLRMGRARLGNFFSRNFAGVAHPT